MAHRILIFVDDKAVHGIEGRHGRTHAATLADTLVAGLVERGKLASVDDALVLELEPAEGGDGVLSDCIKCIDRLVLQWHHRPDGQRELVGVYRRPRHGIVAGDSPEARAEKVRRQQVAAPSPVHGGIRLLRAPADVYGTRRELSPGTARLEPPHDPAMDARTARRLATARSRP